MSDATAPTVTGPVTGGAHGWAFGGPVVDLARYGYRQDEFFLEGLAVRYAPSPATELGWDGHWEVQPVGTAPYKTRLVVIRPGDPAAFNGTVALAWNNVTAGYDNFGGGDSVELLTGGFAFVAVSAQRVSVHGISDNPQGLLAWDPDRYGSLSIPSDDYAFDIFTQAATVVAPDRPRNPVDPMGGLDVAHVVAQGASQSAARLATYVNAIQPIAGVIDSFMLTLYFGSGTPLEVGEAVVNLNAAGDGEDSTTTRLRLVGSHLLRDDLAIPIMVVNSECEATSCYGVRQPDTQHFRYWEVAGTSHVYRQAMDSVAPRYERDFGFAVSGFAGINEVPTAPVMDAALHHMQMWVSGGPPPPIQPRIEFHGEPPEISRDEHGIARGGIRLPQVDVPIAHNSALQRTPDNFARLAGSCDPFEREKLQALYGDQGGYLARFETAAQAAEKAGVILPRDAAGMVAEAATTGAFGD
jgi:hypothetical protein